MRKEGKKPGGVTGKGFQPGQSGASQKGLTKGTVCFKRVLEEKLKKVWERDYLKRTALELIADHFFHDAIVKKSWYARSEIIERIDGKPAQAVTLDANLNISREQRIAKVEELLAALSAPQGCRWT